MSARRGLALLAMLALAAGCRAGQHGAAAGPRLEVQWTGSDTASFGAPATAEWCDTLRLLEILAIAGDTGIGIALYPKAGLEVRAYPIRRPGVADSARPSAAIGLRWFAATAVQGFQADSGELSLTRAGGGALSGRFSVTAHAISGNRHLSLTGSFRDLVERPAARGCPAPASPDTGAGVD